MRSPGEPGVSVNSGNPVTRIVAWFAPQASGAVLGVYAIEQIDPALDDTTRAVALKAIDDTIYGLMMVLDGVSGGLGNSEYLVHLQTKVCLTKRQTGPSEVVDSVDLHRGDGMCMGFHQWLQGDFGEDVVAVPRQSARKS